MPIYDLSGNKLYDKGPTTQELINSRETIKKSLGSQRYGSFTEFPMYFPHPGTFGRLSYALLRHLYETSSSIRPAVDDITRTIISYPYVVSHVDGKYHPKEEYITLQRFFDRVNYDHEDLASVLQKFVNDQLVIGKGVIEKVRSTLTGTILELRTRDAALFHPIYDRDNGGIQFYQESHRLDLTPYTRHSKNDIIYQVYNPVSYSVLPLPIIETIVNEISLLMLTVKFIASNFMNDEIPPGVLHLGNIGEIALDRAKASFEATKGEVAKGKMRVVDNVDKVAWVQFTRPFREMQLAELIPIIERIVARNFGLAPVEAGLAESGRGTAEVSQQTASSKLILPLQQRITIFLNRDVLYELNPDYQISFVPRHNQRSAETVAGIISLWKSGIYTRNNALRDLGKDPVKGGDLHTVLLGNEVVPLDEETGLPLYRNPAVGVDGTSPPPPSAQQPKEDNLEAQLDNFTNKVINRTTAAQRRAKYAESINEYLQNYEISDEDVANAFDVEIED